MEVDRVSPVQDLLEFTVSELIKSEKEYVARLNYAMLHYLPVIFGSMAPRALRAQKATLLGNLKDIWEFHSKQFLPALVDAGGDLDKIGRVFLIHQDSFEHYITFCGNKTKSEAVYSEFRPHMMEAMHALGQRLELSSYLILPIQRLTKCGLLLADILKYVNRLDRKSLPLEMAAVMLQDASTRSNNSIHYFELEGLAKKDLPLCDLDFQDLFWVKCDGVWKERRVFLFKTAIVLTKPLLHEGMGQSLVIQKVVELTSVSVAEDDLEESLTSLVFYDLKGGSKIILQASSAEIKTTWAKKMSDLISACKNASKAALTRTVSDSTAVFFKRGSSFNLRRSWLSRTRSEKRRRLTDGGSPLVVRKKSSELPTVGCHLLVLECIVVEDADDVTLEAGDTVKLLRIMSPDKYLVQTVDDSNATVEGIVSAEFLRVIGEESKLEVAPEIQMFPGNTVVHLGKAAILSCCFAAYPAPSVVWMKDSQVIHPTQKVKLHTSPTSSVLELLGVEFSDKGEYTCVVSNSGGSTEASGYLLVQGPPGAPGQPNAVKVTSTTAKLKWTSPIFDGGDDVTYQLEQQHFGSQAWQPVVQLTKPAFLVRDLEPATVYAFRVVAFHTHGCSPPSQVSEPVKTKSLAKSGGARNDHAVSPDFLSSPSSSTPPCEIQSYHPYFITTGPVSASYSILNHVLGVGQFSVVRQAFNRQTKQVCAAKEVSNKLLGCGEAKILHQLNHPHIVKLFDAYELVGGVTLLTEMVSEGELLEYIVSKDNLTEAVCVRYLTQLLRALDYLSQKNLVHLDIKPENLLLSRMQNDLLALKLIDFGSAHEASLPEAPREFISPEFLPPEVLGGESPCSCPVSDMWSVGVVTYVMLSGISPFFASTPESTISRILDARYSFSNDAFAQVSEDAKSFIASLLQLSPRHRSTASKALHHIWITTLGTSNEGWPMAKLDTAMLRRFLSRRKWLCKAVAISGISQEEESGDSSPSIVALHNERCESPLLWDGPHNVTAATGSTVMLRCRFNGIPTPSIYWYHEGKEVTSGDRVSLSAKDGVASLHILCLEPSLAGEYMCTAVNSVGTATTEAVITAQDVPGSPAEIKVVPLSPMSALLSWIPPKSHGNSDLQHYIVEQSPARKECWTEFTRSASTTALVVDNLSTDETYNFRVSAVNRVGQGPFSKPITLERSQF